MTEGPDEAAGKSSEGNVEPGQSAKRVAKTKMYQTGTEPADATDAAEAQPEAQQQNPQAAPPATAPTEPRKVAKTLMYDTGNQPVYEAAQAAADAAVPPPAAAPPSAAAPAQSQPARTQPVSKTRIYPLAAESFAAISKSKESHKRIRKTLLYEAPTPREGAKPFQGMQPGELWDSVAEAKPVEAPMPEAAYEAPSYQEEVDYSIPTQYGLAAPETPERTEASPMPKKPTVGRVPNIPQPAGPGATAKRPSQIFVVAKTKLDHSVLAMAVSKYEAKQEKKALEIMAEKALEPVKKFTPVDSKRLATPCAWSWPEGDSKENFRYCGKCNAAVYNFEGMEAPEAEALIFKRESKRNPPLYKRADGKFMTGDCPLELKRKNDRVMLILLAVALVVGAVVVIAMMPPPPPKPVQAEQPKTEQPLGSDITGGTRVPAKTSVGKDGSFHWEEGQKLPPKQPVPVTSSPNSVSPNTYKAPDPDETGGFWQYSSGQPGGAPVQPTQPNR